jgi:AdoMet-dependent heme synthase
MARLTWLDYDVDNSVIRNSLLELVSQKSVVVQHEDKRLQTIYLFLTRRCNLSCQHCYVEGVGPARDNDFDMAAIQEMVRRAIPYGLKKVKVSGGEPLVRADALQILEYLDSLDLEVVLETNGTLFQHDTIERLQGLKDFTIFVSLDHADSEKHDQFRGLSGAYNRSVNVLKQLGKTDIRSVVTTTANRYNYADVVRIANMVLDWGIKQHRTLLNIHPLGNAREHLENAITLDEAEFLIGSLMASPHFRSGRSYMTLPPALTPLSSLRDLHSCGWGESVLGVLSTGDVTMCSASYDDARMIGGNLFEQDLIEIWAHGTFFQKLREVGNGRVKGVCGNCVFYSACKGVCRMSSYSHYGETDAPYPLCQEIYNRGAFPRYALVDPEKDSRYGFGVINGSRSGVTSRLVKITSTRKSTSEFTYAHPND